MRDAELALSPSTWSAKSRDLLWEISDRLDRRRQPPIDTAQDNSIALWPKTYQHPNAEPFVRALRAGLEQYAQVTRVDIPQPYEGIVIFHLILDGLLKRIAFDYFDFTFVNSECARDVDVYLKLQYLREGYPGFSNVLPAGYIASKLFVYRHCGRLRQLRSTGRRTADVFACFGTRFNTAQREQAMRLVTDDPRLRATTGARRMAYTRYLRELAQSSVCLDLPGQGPFCYRLVEALAVGSCVIAPVHRTRMPVELRPGVEYVACADDLGDLLDLCHHFATNHEDRSRVEHAAATYFDAHLSASAFARNCISSANVPSEARVRVVGRAGDDLRERPRLDGRSSVI